MDNSHIHRKRNNKTANNTQEKGQGKEKAFKISIKLNNPITKGRRIQINLHKLQQIYEEPKWHFLTRFKDNRSDFI
jgi:hypothetical protein